MSDLFGGQAHARRSDPETSHLAAAAVTVGLPALQARVERWAIKRPDGFLDVDLVSASPDLGPSTLRTRRAELTARNIILDSGARRKPDGAATPHTVWVHRSHIAEPPPILPPASPPADLKADGTLTAERMESWARHMHGEGRALFAAEIREAAKLMRALSA